jgi:cysteine desulfurase
LAASTGSACHAGQDTPAATLLAMGSTPEVALGAVRLSLGHGTTSEDIDSAFRVLTQAHGECIAGAQPMLDQHNRHCE